MTSQFIVYGLTDPRTHSVRYVGKSTNGLKRPLSPCAPSRLDKDRTHKGNWLRALGRLALGYGVVVIEQLESVELLAERETEWIAFMRLHPEWCLTNTTAGGDGGHLGVPRSTATRAKISATKMGHEVSAETRAKIGAANRGRRHTAAAKQAIRRAGQRAVVELTTGQRYASVREAAAALQTNPASVSLVLSGRYKKTAVGYCFKYADESKP